MLFAGTRLQAGISLSACGSSRDNKLCHLGARKDPLGALDPEKVAFLTLNINSCFRLFFKGIFKSKEVDIKCRRIL